MPCDLTSATATVPLLRPNLGEATFGGHPSPSLDVPYEVTKKEKMILHAITFMKVRSIVGLKRLTKDSMPFV